MKINIVYLALSCSMAITLASGLGEAKQGLSGEKIFKDNCASCHLAGGNRTKPGKRLAGSKELSSLPVFKAYLSKPPGHMPYYQHIVSDPKALKALYNYCRELKPQPMKQAMR